MITVVKKTQKEMYNSLAFVSKAISKDDTRQALGYVKIDNGRIIATDGYRLHVYHSNLDADKNGLYELIKTAKEIKLIPITDEMTYPDVDKVIPHYDTKGGNKPIDFQTTDHKVIKKNSHSVKISKLLYRLAKKDIGIDYNLAEGLVDIFYWDVYYNEALSPVLFKNSTHTAVIMPYMTD